MRQILRHILPGLLLLLSAHLLQAQTEQRIQGKVIDVDSRQPIDMALVSLLQGGEGKPVSYTLSDAQGNFSLPTAGAGDSLQIGVSLLGYRAQRIPISIDTPHHLILLHPQLFEIKEVEIRPGRIWAKGDTVNYNVAEFLTPQDETIKDVIRKLPGLSVDDLGAISYNGRKISRFYVEGMDLSNGRYNRITNNLEAKAVDKVQLLDGHQPIRLLKDRVKTEEIALNLTLKPEFRDRWLVTLRIGGGYTLDEPLWEGAVDVMQLSRKSQSAYHYKSNNYGHDATKEQLMLTDNSAESRYEPALATFLSQPSLSSPLKEERLLFNRTHTLSGNRLYKLNETTQLKINAEYTHDQREQSRGSETIYFQQEQDTVRIVEESHTALRKEAAEVGLYLEKNEESHFLTNSFLASGSWENSRMALTGFRAVEQQIRTEDIGLRNSFRTMWNREDYTYEVTSVTRYHHLPSRLLVDDYRQQLAVNDFFTDNSFSLMHKQQLFTQQYAAGITGHLNSLHHGYSLYLRPMWQYNDGRWLATVTLPLIRQAYPAADFTRYTANPSLMIRYKMNYAWQYRLHISYRESCGELTSLYDAPYLSNYRTEIAAHGWLPVTGTQYYSLYGEYKNTINEFFATVSLSHTRSRSDRTWEQRFEAEKMILEAHRRDSRSTGWSLAATLSKGFYDWKMKAALDIRLLHSQAEQLSGGRPLPYTARSLHLEPRLSWNPFRQFEADYQATFRYGGSQVGEESELTPLWNIVQQLGVTYSLSQLQLRFAIDHYYNDIIGSPSYHALFADASIRWKAGNWQVELTANNLLDKERYDFVQYSSLQQYSSRIDIRRRDLIASVRYRF